jgi:RNA polymerase sigma factor (sigma-70 family)
LTPLTDEQRKLAEDHMGVAIAYVRARRWMRKNEDDFQQVAFLALSHAARKYGPNAGCDFPVYAYQRIRRAVANYLNTLRTIRIPVDGHKNRHKTKAAEYERAKERAKAMKGDTIEAMVEVDQEPASAFPGPAEAYERAETIQAVRAAVDRLTPLQRQTVLACDMGGREITSFAAERGVTPTAVQTSRRLAREKLRRFLTKHVDTVCSGS